MNIFLDVWLSGFKSGLQEDIEYTVLTICHGRLCIEHTREFHLDSVKYLLLVIKGERYLFIDNLC